MLESFQRLQKETGSATGAFKSMIGSLSGAGGLGIVISIVSSLLIVFGDKLFAAKKTTEELKEETKGLTQSLEEEITAYSKLTTHATEREIQLQKELDLRKALGVVNGEVAKSEIEVEQKSQAVRDQRAKSIKDQIDLINEVNKAFTRTDDDFETRSRTEYDKAQSAHDRAIDYINKYAGLVPSAIIDQVKDEVKKLETTGGTFADFAASTNKKLNTELTKINNESEVAAQQQATVFRNRQSDLRKQLIEENKSLNKQLRENQIDNDKSLIGDQILFIKTKNDLDRQAALHAIDVAELEARKTGALPGNEGLFASERNKINASFDEQYLKEKREFYIKVQREQEQYQLSILQTQAEFAKRQLGIDIDTTTDTLAERQALSEKERVLAIDQLTLKYNELYRKASLGEADMNQVISDYATERVLVENETNRKILKAQEDFYTEQKKNLEDDLKLQLDTNRANGVLQSKLAIDRQKRAEAEAEVQNARNEQSSLFGNPNATKEDFDKNLQRIADAQNKLKDINKEIKKDHLDLAHAIESAYLSITQSIVNALETVYAAQQKQLDNDISIQERRVAAATVLAERGNTESLRIEQERLDALDKQKAQSVKKQIELNALLGLSNSALAISTALEGVLKAASNTTEGGAISYIAAIAAGFAAVVGLYASVRTLSESQKGFKKGGYTGDGDANQTAGVVHRGEFVMSKEVTSRNRPLLELIQSGKPILNFSGQNDGFASKKELQALGTKMDRLIEVTSADKYHSEVGITDGKIYHVVERQKSTEQRKWKP